MSIVLHRQTKTVRQSTELDLFKVLKTSQNLCKSEFCKVCSHQTKEKDTVTPQFKKQKVGRHFVVTELVK